jgi:hypothetical protein
VRAIRRNGALGLVQRGEQKRGGGHMSRSFTRWAMLALALLVFALSIFSGVETRRVVVLEAKIQHLKNIQGALIEKFQHPETPEPFVPNRPHEI